ncbi:hypothetical protein HKT18_13600 [Flavobacterium sp. IMCC34852]|uniref:Uncharacterized protein n=1 Tax=Flavobacterium rivulicola TaxID=2732161 RepID=A0A7Y3RB39_9FLAO|nr:hypothetical protein [Flavobacterium sp. IMCC34852]NNT73254.1 hypothetical protein [Flavobacterium sp. IMCC34852]
MNLKKYFLPKGWTEKKISEDTYLLTIPQEELEAWKIKRWKKDNVEKLIRENGFHMKSEGRSGTIYFVQENQVCEIYFEVSGVKEFDILISFEGLTEWELPERKTIGKTEKEEILEKLKIWLKEKKIKSDL